jgi:hypothetical protein
MRRQSTRIIFAVFMTGVLAGPALWPRAANAQYVGQRSTPVHTSPFQVVGPSCELPNSVANSEFQMLDAPVKLQNCMVTPQDGYQRGAVGAHTRIDMRGKAGKNWTLYSSAECFGYSGSSMGECGSLYGRLESPEGSGPLWQSAGFFEFRNRSQNHGTGMALGLEIRDHYQEKYGVQGAGEFYGIVLQPYPNLRGVRGLRFMNGHTYQYTVDHDSGFERIGTTDGTPFCRKYEPITQQMLYIRGCDQPGAQVVHVIDLNWKPDLPLYVPGRRY